MGNQKTLNMDQDLKLIELEMKCYELLYLSYPEGSDARAEYIGSAHTESRRMLNLFKTKWNLKL